MPNNLKVLGSIHENMLQGCIPSVSPQFTSSEQVEFKASVNGLHNSSAAELSERMAKSLTPQNGLLVTETNLCKNVANEIPGNDLHDHKNLPAKDSQVYWRRFSEKDVCKTQDKTAAIKSFSSWRDIEKNSLQIHSSLHQTTPLVGLKNHLNTQHGVFEAHNMSIDRDKCDTGVKTLPCVNNKPPQLNCCLLLGKEAKTLAGLMNLLEWLSTQKEILLWQITTMTDYKCCLEKERSFEFTTTTLEKAENNLDLSALPGSHAIEPETWW